MHKLPIAALAISATMLISGCDNPAPTKVAAKKVAVAPPAASVPSIDDKTVVSICKAAIAELNGHSPKIMKAGPMTAGIVSISYRRPDDGKAWTNECKIEGERIFWRTVDGAPGRWRIDPADEILTFKIEGKVVEIKTTYSDGSTASNKQPLI